MLLVSIPLLVATAALITDVPVRRRGLPLPSVRYNCDTCSCRFDQLKQLNEHLASATHAARVARGAALAEEYTQPGWHDGSAEGLAAAAAAFRLDAFLDGLPRRTRSTVPAAPLRGDSANAGTIAPSLRASDLSVVKRAQLGGACATSSPRRPYPPPRSSRSRATTRSMRA